MPGRTMRGIAVAATLVLLAGACSSKTNKEPSSSGGETTPPATATSTSQPLSSATKAADHGTKDASTLTVVSIEVDDRYFEPTFVKAKAGGPLTVNLENAGEFVHTFTIKSLNVDEELQPGDKKTVILTLGQSDVAFYCRFHVSSGMWGSFYFGASPTATPATT